MKGMIKSLNVRPKAFKTKAGTRPVNLLRKNVNGMNMNANVFVALLDYQPLLKKRTKGLLEMLKESLLGEITLRIGKETSTMVKAVARRGKTTFELLALKKSRRR